MEANQTQQTEKLIEEMLGFLDSSTDEEDEESNEEEQENDDEDEEEDAYESAKDEQNESSTDKEQSRKPKQKRPKSSIAKEIKKIKNSFPIWNTREIAPTAKRLVDPIWRQSYGNANKYEQAVYENDWNSKLESNCRRSSNSYVQEVNRAIYGDTNGHPANGSADYYQAAQNYAIYGKDFLDFPENLTPLLGEKSAIAPVAEPSSSPYIGNTPSNTGGYGNGLYPTPATPAPEAAGVSFANFGKQLAAAGAASTAAYYQMCNGLQPNVRPTAANTGAAGSTAYGMFLGNKVTYVATAPPNAPPPLVYNQHSSTTTNFISNSLANAALASSPAILYSNPMLTTTTQQYLNTFFKETQYLSGGTTQGAVTGTTTGIYERLVYAQMLQQQIYHQTQQQAAAVAAMFQHKQRPRSNGVGPSNNAPSGAPGGGVTAGVSSPGAAVGGGLNLCGRQAAMANTPSNELLAKNVAAAAVSVPLVNGADDLVVAAAAVE